MVLQSLKLMEGDLGGAAVFDEINRRTCNRPCCLAGERLFSNVEAESVGNIIMYY